ncbi:hypothetical protein [Chelatococcus asaccharovorans]|uniref:hypothetical protein n=1 Tax=Chelatococcus asaccharovorans TaxID=28210 RepID=UPI00224C738A|nr:hypothetical protein [Chelatococcus asaccharovorans]CAH1657899.1 conserved exported hypothetical protein [Chelatococcus asaccharovorans]CAH1688957.1 conserved exported hypothetical protein [Chelatococcus asaccharovorans]
MRSFIVTIADFTIYLFTAAANAQPSRQQITVPTPHGPILVENFGNCENATCPAVVILSGSMGSRALVYDEIGRKFRAAGLNAYLVHVLSADDLDAIGTASNAQARIAYYARRLPE